ncbi:jg868 [Pararge aegeria aegeria]|uniref:Jg868 protein n=1 Tax=Pararge aegeria aegeria TaxID=348720 RepID=A0A8S4RWD6_9NEOP|nr:jg868 [Pararge aegeria aegeria]
MMADFNRLHKGHIGTAPKSAFKKKSHEPNKSDWTSYVFNQLSVWESLHRQWITKFLGPIHVVFYELLVRDTRNSLLGILNFLNHTVSEEDMNCAVAKREGIYKRKKKYKDFEPFSPEMYSAIYTVRQRVLKLVKEYNDKHKNITLVVVESTVIASENLLGVQIMGNGTKKNVD